MKEKEKIENEATFKAKALYAAKCTGKHVFSAFGSLFCLLSSANYAIADMCEVNEGKTNEKK